MVRNRFLENYPAIQITLVTMSSYRIHFRITCQHSQPSYFNLNLGVILFFILLLETHKKNVNLS